MKNQLAIRISAIICQLAQRTKEAFISETGEDIIT